MESSTNIPLVHGIAMDNVGARGAVYLVLVVVLFTAFIKKSNQTDIPKIKNLPELPGVPFFGSLFLLGRYHARNCARLAKSYGDVFQARLGNRVCPSLSLNMLGSSILLTYLVEVHLRQLVRVRQRTLDQEPVGADLTTQVLDIPRSRLRNPGRVHPWNLALE